MDLFEGDIFARLAIAPFEDLYGDTLVLSISYMMKHFCVPWHKYPHPASPAAGTNWGYDCLTWCLQLSSGHRLGRGH
jgi:hypothetical protein